MERKGDGGLRDGVDGEVEVKEICLLLPNMLKLFVFNEGKGIREG